MLLETSAGHIVAWQPWNNSKVELFTKESRDLKEGDVIRWTRGDRLLGRRNGEFGRVVALDDEKGSATVETSPGKLQTLDLTNQRHWEHGYASTIYSAQGKTSADVLIHLDTRQQGVMGQDAWYVAISRARDYLEVFTDDESRLPEAIKRELSQKSAIEELEKGSMKSPEVDRKDGEPPGRDHPGHMLERFFGL